MRAALALAAIASLQNAAAPAALSDPYQIFANARSYWIAQRYPAQVQYTIVVRADAGDKPDARHYTAWWTAATNGTAVNPVSAEESAHPYRPAPGVNLFLPFVRRPIASIGGPRNGVGINTDLVGVPVLAPNYAFAIAPYVPPQKKTPAQIVGEIRAEFHDPLPPERVKELPASQIPVIAVVSASTRRYIISLVDVEPYGDHQDYHLALKPVHDPNRYRLRAMWVDTRTFATDKLEQDGNFTTTTATGVPWTVTFHDIAGSRYVDTESETPPLGQGQDALHDVTVTFEDVAAASAPPAFPMPAPFGALYEPLDP